MHPLHSILFAGIAGQDTRGQYVLVSADRGIVTPIARVIGIAQTLQRFAR
jgi:hypothetical protein